MARNRQRAKQRQAERRAARLESRGTTGGAEAPERAVDGRGAEPPHEPEPVDVLGDGAASAPPEDTGRSDTVVASRPPRASADPDADPDLHADPAVRELDAPALEAPEAELARADRPAEQAEAEAVSAPPERGRVLAFLAAVWAELGRVQWPTRQAVISLTGIVLGFVALAGGYLGLLDAIFSRLIHGIL